ncbi:alpha/beta hydrolase-fold protein [Zhouia spongiae]|uniref:Alpha/beta hydrolase-fold protein n=1 Tax=Zhouia spongiae TaxID=2202721 RepID=A0ABY3YR19_9FLAO|nr:alpha/beta hydrolase-fold protein [Zhouia spongiae]UNY99984.1 alpha/beta hydrolase-fold protein [Zhouia spongiae]
MKKYLSLVLTLCCISVFAQVKTSKSYSLKLDETRNIRLYIPENYDKEKTYPLFVVLDADYLFDVVVANCKFLTYNGDMPESIIVGIEQRGLRDADCQYGENSLPEKKGNSFFEYLGMELIPSLQKEYNIANFKAVVGHGITANFANYYLLKENPLFKAYISLSPSYAPRMGDYLLDRMKAYEDMTFYYLATASNDLKENSQGAKYFNTQLHTLNNDNIHYYFDDFQNANHYTLASYGIPKALDQFFSIYKPISKEEYQTKVLTYDGPVVDYLYKKYQTMETLFGFKKPVLLNDMMAVYAATKKNKDLPSLEELSKIAKNEFPETMLGFFLEAEYYEQMGEAKKSMRSYEKAFGMQEIDFITKDLALQRIQSIKEDFGW